LKLAPRSAGAVPGPVCYGLGNEEPTVTDANVVLGALNPEHLLAVRMKIDRARRGGDRPARARASGST
jgi:N-methylhydantoinase A